MEMSPRTRNRDNEVDGERSVDDCDRRGVNVTCTSTLEPSHHAVDI
jgi:hypothetical protein